MSQSQRQFGNYFKTSFLSQGPYLKIFAAGVAFFSILFIYLIRMLGEISQSVVQIADPQLSSYFEDRVFIVVILSYVCFLTFLGSAVLGLVIVGHRVGGPLVAIVAYIRDLKAGNYDSKRALRKNDELAPIMNGLKELAAQLKNSPTA